MTIGERLVVMKDGRIRQTGAPEACYHEPADTFVASFLGSPAMNLLEGRFDRSAATVVLDGGTGVGLPGDVMERLGGYTGDRVVLGIRPEHLAPGAADAGLRLSGRLTLREPLGNETITHVEVAGREVIVRGTGEISGDDGVTLGVASRNLHLFSATDGARIGGAGATGGMA
jgi:multiple sugar transport system ATP-binding protein